MLTGAVLRRRVASSRWRVVLRIGWRGRLVHRQSSSRRTTLCQVLTLLPFACSRHCSSIEIAIKVILHFDVATMKLSQKGSLRAPRPRLLPISCEVAETSLTLHSTLHVRGTLKLRCPLVYCLLIITQVSQVETCQTTPPSAMSAWDTSSKMSNLQRR